MMTHEGLGAELPRTLDRNRPNFVSERPWTHAASLEILTDVLDHFCLKGDRDLSLRVRSLARR
jgi:hypothetical protein